MGVWTDLCDRICSYAAGNNFMQVWTDLCNRKLLCSWKRLYTSLDRSVREETLSHHWKRFYANMDGSVRQEMVLCSWNQIYATDCWHELHFEFPAKILTGMCRAHLCGDDSSHSQGQSGKRLLLASRGHPIRSPAYQATCSDPLGPDQTHALDPTPDTPGA